jgi:DNA-binding Lrp family transcriptional regulator
MKQKKTSLKKKPGFVSDEKDEAVIHFMEKNPEVLLKDLPEKLEASGGPAIPYPTLQRRVNMLMAEDRKVVSRIYSVNWAMAGYMVRYRVGILIDHVVLFDQSIPDKKYDSQRGLANHILNELAQEDRFKNKLVVDDVYILLGGNVDLAIDFCAKDDKTATQFIIDALRKLPGIKETTSAKLAYSSKHGWLSKNGVETDQ